MKPERRAAYEAQIHNIEEPIRELVRALWSLPFVRNTGHTCCGHILSPDRWRFGAEGIEPIYVLRPHRAILEIAFEPDKKFEDDVERFKNQLRSVLVEHEGLEMSFNEIWREFSRKEIHSTREAPLHEKWYCSASLPNEVDLLEEANDYEVLLTKFWEAVAAVIREFSPASEIGSIEGKNFREVINWDIWSCVFKTP